MKNSLTKQTARKVPQVAALFWVIKLLTTALGESTSDYLVNKYNPYLVVIAGFIFFVIILLMQLRTKRYTPWIYWLTIVMVAIFGTMAADVIHVAMGVPYTVSSLGFGIILAVIFYLWKRTENTLSIHSIITPRRELFYWATVSATFALGTAAGDLLAYSAHLGFFSAGLIFIGIFMLPVVGYWLLNLNAVLAFWFAYIMTRPIGASFADWTGKAHSVGGLAYGDGPVAGVLALLIIILVGYLQLTHEDVDRTRLVNEA